MKSTTVSEAKTCPHCGAELAPLSVTMMGRPYVVGHVPCTCEAAALERIREAAEQERERKARERSAMLLALERSGIPPAYRDAEHQDASKWTDCVMGGRGLYIHGPVGTWKTTLAASIAKELIARKKRVRFVVAPELARAMRSFDDEDEASYETASSAPVLILDDLDKVNGTPYACERFWNLINFRYNLLLPTIITANVPLGEIADKLGREPTGEAIASRLYQMTEDVELGGEDARLACPAR